MAKTLLFGPNGQPIFEDPGDLMYGEESGPVVPVTCPLDCSSVNLSSITISGVPAPCADVNQTGTTLTRVGGASSCQWTGGAGLSTVNVSCGTQCPASPDTFDYSWIVSFPGFSFFVFLKPNTDNNPIGAYAQFDCGLNPCVGGSCSIS